MKFRINAPDRSPVDPAPDPHRGPKPRRLSGILQDIAEPPATPDARISLGTLIKSFGNRAFGALIFVFALPVCVPIAIPGISAILGAPLLLLAWQLMRGRAQPWLPEVMRKRSLRHADFAAILHRILPWIRRIERLVGPRLIRLTTPRAEQAVGLLAFVLALILFLPVPFGNTVPAIAIAILGLAVLERDGLAVIVGAVIGLAGLAMVSGVIFGLMKAAIYLVQSVISQGQGL